MPRPLRLVIDQDGSLWADNLHGTIAQVICQGMSVTFKDLPVYIMDMRTIVPKIIDGYHLIDLDTNKVTGLLSVSWKRCERSSKELKAVGYTIGEFMDENDLNQNELTLNDLSYLDKFVIKTDLIMHVAF